jgi:pyruvate/2-oxoglutarate dehydrogenase complex dihydrolipoamide dehydrogenase (E3) component
MSGSEWDVLVVGGGTAGMTAARAAAAEGARTLLVERAAGLGGECTWSGCVPSKTLIEAARLVWEVRGAGDRGILAPGLRVDFATLMAHKDDVVAAIARDERDEVLEDAGVAVLHGALVFTSSNEAVVDAQRLRFSRAVIATGSAPAIPPGVGLKDVPHLTNETIFTLTALPRRLLVLGGGPLGLELGQAFARLGSEVTVLHRGARLLSKEEPEVAEMVAGHLADEGLDIRLGVRETTFRRDGDGVFARYGGIGGDRTVAADAVLVATGRRPRLDALGLDALGVRVTASGVAVDSRMRTSVPHVFAAGDVVGGHLFTHVAGYEGRIAGRNAAGRRERADYRVVPWVTFLDPEVARVGLTEGRARAERRRVEVVRFPMSRVDRARVRGRADGLVKLVVAGRKVLGRLGGGEVVGAHIVGPGAGEMLAEVVLAMRTRAFAGRLAQAIHAYPTLSMGVQQAAAQLFPIGRALVDAGPPAPPDSAR